jgi:hypothetical protein
MTSSHLGSRSRILDRLHRRHRAPGLAALVVTTASLGFASLAQADVPFSPPRYLSPAGDSISYPQVAIDSKDRATVVWDHNDGSNFRIQSIRIAADGTLGTVQTLSAPGANAYGPDLAIDSKDRATVAWERELGGVGSTRRIQSVRLAADGAPGRVLNLSAPGRNTANAQVAVDAQDRATVVWDGCDAGLTSCVVQSMRLAADRARGTVQDLSATGKDLLFPQLAINSKDRATVVWRYYNGSSSRIQSIRLRADGTPGAVRNLSAQGGSADSARLAIDSRGRATVVWESCNPNCLVQSIRVRANGTPGAVRQLSPDGGAFPEVAIDSHDRATVVWGNAHAGSSDFIQSIRLRADGTPGAVQNLSAPGGLAAEPSLAIDPQDRATVVWERYNGTHFPGPTSMIQSARISASGTPGGPQDLSACCGLNSYSAGVAVDSQGGATVVWRHYDGSSGFRIQSAQSN